MLEIQKNVNDTSGLGFEKGESSGSGQGNIKSTQQKNNSRKPLVRQPNAYKFNGNCCVCNKFGHMDSQCKNRVNHNGPSYSEQCFKCNKYGHMAIECKSVMKKFQNRRNVRCYACGRFGHVAN